MRPPPVTKRWTPHEKSGFAPAIARALRPADVGTLMTTPPFDRARGGGTRASPPGDERADLLCDGGLHRRIVGVLRHRHRYEGCTGGSADGLDVVGESGATSTWCIRRRDQVHPGHAHRLQSVHEIGEIVGE